jgi:hypothetical protein
MFLNEVLTAGHRVKTFRCDSGNEFKFEEVCHVLSDSGITLFLVALYAPELNRVAKRENHMVVELTRSMLSVSRLQKPTLQYMCSIVQENHKLSGNLQWKCGMVT